MAMNGKDMWLAVFISAQPWLVWAGTFLIGYLFGSIPFGYLYGRLAGVGDIRTIGSGNIGATNVLRTGRKGLALATLLSDAAKGFVPVLLIRQYLGVEPAMAAAAGAFLGHLYPVWLNFRGGKGVATYIGVITALYWPAGVFFCAAWLCIALATRYSSLSALVAAALTPVFVAFLTPGALYIFLAVLSVILIAKHHQNIRNLISGHETKIGQTAAGTKRA